MGKIFFLLVRIKIKHMEVELRRRESSGTGTNTCVGGPSPGIVAIRKEGRAQGSPGPLRARRYNESETIAKYEIMDGAPVRGESVPVRAQAAFGGSSSAPPEPP